MFLEVFEIEWIKEQKVFVLMVLPKLEECRLYVARRGNQVQ